MVRTVTWGAFVQMRQRGERVRETPESFILVSTEIVGVLNHWSKINLALVNSVWSMERPVFQFGHFLTRSPGLPDISPYPNSTGLEIQWDLKFSQAPGAIFLIGASV